jgi:hypothetical protein
MDEVAWTAGGESVGVVKKMGDRLHNEAPKRFRCLI